MSLKITIANTPELLDSVFKLRHQVFVEEEKLLRKTPDGRLIDRFDAYPTTSNLMVKGNEDVIGTLRMTLDSSVGMPADNYYDFRKHVPHDSRLMHCGLFCVPREHRNPKITTGLLLMAAYFSTSHEITHIVAPINPKIARLLKRIGFRAVGDEFTEPHTGAIMLPLILNMSELKDFFIHFVKQNQLQDFLGDYERWFYKAGEFIIKAGEVGEEAFVMIEGNAQVRLPGSSHIMGELREGEVFGELALLTDEVRSADVVAVTDVQVMTLPKSVFMKRFSNNPGQTLNLMKLMGKRTQNLIQQLEKQII